MTKARDLANAGTALTSVSATELGYLDGTTSSVQTQLDAKAVYPSQTGNSGKYLTTNGSATSWGTVTAGGLVYITSSTFTASTAPSINNCFTSTYRNYKIVINIDSASSSASNLAIRMRVSGADNSSNYYYFGIEPNSGSGTMYTTAGNGVNIGAVAYQGENGTDVSIDIYSPALAQKTHYTTSYATSTPTYILIGGTYGGTHNVATAYDGFTLIPNGGNITGTIRVYGYANS